MTFCPESPSESIYPLLDPISGHYYYASNSRGMQDPLVEDKNCDNCFETRAEDMLPTPVSPPYLHSKLNVSAHSEPTSTTENCLPTIKPERAALEGDCVNRNTLNGNSDSPVVPNNNDSGTRKANLRKCNSEACLGLEEGSRSTHKACGKAYRGNGANNFRESPSFEPGPIQTVNEVQRELATLGDGDPVFTLALDVVMNKQLAALNDRDSLYMFRDFAGHYASLLDRFGPGGFDSHRAPSELSWMIKLLLPWLYIDNEDTKINIGRYLEVSSWLQNIGMFAGSRCSEFIMEGGAWDACVQQMANKNVEISMIAYSTAKVLISTLPLTHRLVNKVLSTRTDVFKFDARDTREICFKRIMLLGHIVDRIDVTYTMENASEYCGYLSSVISELQCTTIEVNDKEMMITTGNLTDHATRTLNVLESLNSEKYSSNGTFQSMNSIRSGHVTLSSRSYGSTVRSQGPHTELQLPLERTERRFYRFLRRVRGFFKRSVNTEGSEVPQNGSNELDIITL